MKKLIKEKDRVELTYAQELRRITKKGKVQFVAQGCPRVRLDVVLSNTGLDKVLIKNNTITILGTVNGKPTKISVTCPELIKGHHRG
jgi:hypothetical protein